MIDQVRLLFWILRPGQQVLEQQDLVGGRSDFRHENPVLGIQVGLGVR